MLLNYEIFSFIFIPEEPRSSCALHIALVELRFISTQARPMVMVMNTAADSRGGVVAAVLRHDGG